MSPDTDSEATETFHVRLANGAGATISDGAGTGSITNDDAPPPTVSVGDVTAPEGDPPATTTFSFPVTVANAPASGSMTVTYGIEGDTATAGTDYTTGGGTLTFTFPGPTTVTADVSISADTAPEPDETFQLVLTAVTGVPGATIADNAGQGTITNDDSPPPPPTVVEVRVATGNDDAEESAAGSVSLTSSDLELVLDGSNQTVGMRFAGLAVPSNAQITNAYVQFTVDAPSSGATSLTLAGEASGNAAVFAKTTRNISARLRTDPSVAVTWAPVSWTARGQAGASQRTPNLAAVVQQIVDRSGWTSGNALALIATGSGKRTAIAFNGTASAAPLLHIEYVLP